MTSDLRTPTGQQPTPPSLAAEFQNVTKSFGSLLANDDCSLKVARGSIHAIVGENGAGKSTLMNSLYGMHSIDSGEIRVFGRLVNFRTPMEAIESGVGMVHQHFKLVPTLTGWQNTILGSEPRRFYITPDSTLGMLEALKEKFKFTVDLHKLAEELPVGHQQQLEILKLLYRRAEILLLDEPTAVLAPSEIDALLAQLHTLKSEGKTILFISHKLREILRFAEIVTVLRAGKVVGTYPTSSLNQNDLAELMVGRKTRPLASNRTAPSHTPVLDVRDLSFSRVHSTSLTSIGFQVFEGEILGVAGIEGNGQTELFNILAGIEPNYSGHVSLAHHHWKKIQLYDVKQQGFAVIPPDRLEQAVAVDLEVGENVILGHHREKPYSNGFRLFHTKVNQYADAVLERFDVRPRLSTSRMGDLSGGNQQKAVIGRELFNPPKFILAAHPTRGVDIGAIENIHSKFIEARNRGCALLVFSSELDELFALCDRLIVLFEGRIRGELPRELFNETQVGLWMTGGQARDSIRNNAEGNA